MTWNHAGVYLNDLRRWNPSTQQLTFPTTVAIYLRGTTTLAMLYTDENRSGILANPVPINQAPGTPGVSTVGNLLIFAEPDLYDGNFDGDTEPILIQALPDDLLATSDLLSADGGSVLGGSLEIGAGGSLIFTDTAGVRWSTPKPMVNTSGQLITQMLSSVVQPTVGFVGGTPAAANAAAGSIVLPPTIQTGQLILLCITAANAGTALTMSTPPSGYTQQAAWDDSAAGSGINGWIYSKTAGAGGSAVAWGVSNNTLAAFETALGHPADMVRDYAWIDFWVSSWATLASTHQMALSWKWRLNSGAGVAATSIWNGTTSAYATSLQTFCTNFVNMPAPPTGKHQATFEHELDVAASQSSGSNAQIITAFQHCCTVLRATPGFDPTIHEIAACFGAGGGKGGGSTFHTAAQWLAFFTALFVPGTYADTFWLDMPYINDASTTGDSLIGPPVDWCTANFPAMPIYVGEWGVKTSSLTVAQCKTAMDQFATALKTSRYANVVGLMYWSSGNYALSGANLAEWASLEPGGAGDAGATVNWTLSASAKQNAAVAAYKDVNSVSVPATQGSADIATNQLTAPGTNPGHEIVEFYASLNQGGNSYSTPGNVSRRIFSPGSGANTPDLLIVDSNGQLSSGGDTVTSSQQVSRSLAATVALHTSAISFVSSATAITNGTTLTGTVPLGIQSGDQIFVFLSLAFGGTDVALNTPPAGYSAVGSPWVKDVGAASIDAWMYHKTATGGDAGASVAAVFASAVKCQMTILVYRGVSSWALSTASDAALASHVLPTVSATPWVVAGVSSRTSSANTYSGPAGYSQRALQQGSGGGNVDSYVADSGGVSSTGGGTVVCSASAGVAVQWAMTLS